MPRLTSVDWFKVTGDGALERFSDTATRHRSGFFSAQLVFPNGFRSTDSGNYVCSARSNDRNSPLSAGFMLELQASLPTLPTAPCSVDSNAVYFEMNVLDSGCYEWDANLKQQVIFQLQRSILGVLTVQCEQCSLISDSLMITAQPICSSQAAVFRGVISRDTQDIFCALNSWLQSGSTVPVKNSLHLIDRSCNLRIESLNSTDTECITITTGGTTDEKLQAQLSPAVGPTVSIAVLLVVGAVAVVGVIAVVKIRR